MIMLNCHICPTHISVQAITSKVLGLNAAELRWDGWNILFRHALKKERASERALPLTYMCHTLFIRHSTKRKACYTFLCGTWIKTERGRFLLKSSDGYIGC